jgi:hypothetical protein
MKKHECNLSRFTMFITEDCLIALNLGKTIPVHNTAAQKK